MRHRSGVEDQTKQKKQLQLIIAVAGALKVGGRSGWERVYLRLKKYDHIAGHNHLRCYCHS
jgi:hypothetical protein